MKHAKYNAIQDSGEWKAGPFESLSKGGHLLDKCSNSIFTVRGTEQADMQKMCLQV